VQRHLQGEALNGVETEQARGPLTTAKTSSQPPAELHTSPETATALLKRPRTRSSCLGPKTRARCDRGDLREAVEEPFGAP